MQRKSKMHAWNSWTLVLAMVVLFIVHPASCGNRGTNKIGEDCTEVGDCIENGECADGPPKKCACPSQFTASADKGTCMRKCDRKGATDQKCTGTTWTPECLPSTAAAGAQLVCGKACDDCATGTCIYKSADASTCFLTCGAKTCDSAVSKCNAANDDCEAKTCTKDADCPGHKCVTASAGKAMVCGKACASACEDATPICVATDHSASACKACSDEKYPCPEGKTCTAGKCEDVVESSRQQAEGGNCTSDADCLQTPVALKCVSEKCKVMGESTTANSTENSAPGMPSAAGSLILLTCAAALVLTAA